MSNLRTLKNEMKAFMFKQLQRWTLEEFYLLLKIFFLNLMQAYYFKYYMCCGLISLFRNRSSSQCFLSLSWFNSKRIKRNIVLLFHPKSWREVYKKWDDKSKNWNHLFLFSCFKRKMPGGLGIYRKFKFVIENKKCICGLKKKYQHVTLKLWYL